MNTQKLTDAATVMRRAAEGAQIEARQRTGKGEWEQVELPSWNWALCDFRVKVREWRVTVWQLDSAENLSKAEADPGNLVLVREVIP